MSFKTQLGICLLAGAFCGVIAAILVPMSTPPVEADARLPKATSIAPPVAPVVTAVVAPAPSATPIVPAAAVTSPTPVFSAAAKKAATKPRTDILRGIASWYGSVLNGHRTASGERFDMYAMTACHPTLPFGTLVRVIDLDTQKSVVVRINDRGELSKGRVIDLSYAAAHELNITKAGLAPVALEVVSLGMARHKK
jgi:peptidoglycan lytic transglycosylase